MREIKIGRSNDCDISIHDPTVSRMHATLLIAGITYSVQDENSANGTYINGNRISGISVLKENDILKVGNTVVPWKNYVTLQEPDPSPVPVPKANANNTTVHEQKKPGVSGARVVGGLIIAILLALVVFFFYNSQKDDLRISGTWVCDNYCGNLKKLTFEGAKENQGDYQIITNSPADKPVKGTWLINTTDKFIKLTPGLMSVTDSIYASNAEVTYKYDIKKNILSLTRWENGQGSGNEITLVKPH